MSLDLGSKYCGFSHLKDQPLPCLDMVPLFMANVILEMANSRTSRTSMILRTIKSNWNKVGNE